MRAELWVERRSGRWRESRPFVPRKFSNEFVGYLVQDGEGDAGRVQSVSDNHGRKIVWSDVDVAYIVFFLYKVMMSVSISHLMPQHLWHSRELPGRERERHTKKLTVLLDLGPVPSRRPVNDHFDKEIQELVDAPPLEEGEGREVDFSGHEPRVVGRILS